MRTRARLDGLPLLAGHLLERLARLQGMPLKSLSTSALERLASYDWPGHVRELENVLIRALILSNRATIEVGDLELPGSLASDLISVAESFQRAKQRVVQDFERRYIAGMLDRHYGNVTHAARSAGKDGRAFWELMRKHGLTKR